MKILVRSLCVSFALSLALMKATARRGKLWLSPHWHTHSLARPLAPSPLFALQVFGIDSFRTVQRHVINATLSNRDVFLIMPTVCFSLWLSPPLELATSHAEHTTMPTFLHAGRIFASGVTGMSPQSRLLRPQHTRAPAFNTEHAEPIASHREHTVRELRHS